MTPNHLCLIRNNHKEAALTLLRTLLGVSDSMWGYELLRKALHSSSAILQMQKKI